MTERPEDYHPIQEEQLLDGAIDSEVEVTPEDFINCKNCLRALTEDEKIINARFVNEAIQAARDISIFPVCLTCHFEKLEITQYKPKQKPDV